MTRALRVLAALAGAALLTAGCSSSSSDGAPRPSATPTPTPPARATAVPAPKDGACHRLTYAQALAPTTTDRPVGCRGSHTSQTYAVGRLTTAVDGHLVAVDSPRVTRQVATACPGRLTAFLGGSQEDLRLSMLRAVWFTPTVAASDAGADWYRCDVIAVAGDQRLATLSGSLEGALKGADADRYAMCGTAGPGSSAFKRVACREKHTWRALRTITFDGSSYPGTTAAKDAGQKPCQQEGQDVAKDALDYQWAYEWPTAKQWAAGQTYGICWAPD